MPDWRNQYLANLHEAERNNPVNKDLVSACSQLADRVAALEAEKAVLLRSASSSAPSKTAPASNGRDSSANSDPATATDTDAVAQLRLDLAEALRSRGQLQAKFKTAEAELQKLRAKGQTDDKRVRELAAERSALATRLRDRSEELVEKNRLLKDVQDENLTLNIHLDAAERNMQKVKDENKMLVDRWMQRMGEEADAMNLANEPATRTNGKKR
ncbi:hypothetical protein JX266_000887 [Neoarthrinium moseri]|nr:hypothetical protein JX266_000887 [Neoarthrinium moseri]